MVVEGQPPATHVPEGGDEDQDNNVDVDSTHSAPRRTSSALTLPALPAHLVVLVLPALPGK